MNIIDTRDLLKRKEELEALRDAVTEAQDELKEAEETLAAFDPDRPDVAPDDEDWYEKKEELEEAVIDAKSSAESAQEDFGTDEQTELEELEELESEISDFRHGETMIDSYDFEKYAQQLAEDIGAIPDNAQWPCTCIDWEQAAKELEQDYTTVTYQGTDYLVRA